MAATKVPASQVKATSWSAWSASLAATGEFTYVDTYTVDITDVPVGATVFITSTFTGNGGGTNHLARVRILYAGTTFAEGANRDSYYFSGTAGGSIVKTSGNNSIVVQRATSAATTGNYAAFVVGA